LSPAVNPDQLIFICLLLSSILQDMVVIVATLTSLLTTSRAEKQKHVNEKSAIL
jgi:hypothetical protein